MKLASLVTCLSLLLALPAMAEEAPKNALISFDIVCSFNAKGCNPVEIAPGKPPLFIQPTPIFTLADIAKVSLQDDARVHGGKMLMLVFREPHRLHDATQPQVGRELAIFIKGNLVMLPLLKKPFEGNVIAISGQNSRMPIDENLAAEMNDAINKQK